jgi:EF-P beta-lysylation protein EpmB
MAAAESSPKEAHIITGFPRQAMSWQQELANAFVRRDDLIEFLGLDPAPLSDPVSTDPEFPLRVPRGFARRMQPGNMDDPLLRQVLPDNKEDLLAAGFEFDPVGDLDSRRAPGVLHKYRGRVLLIGTGACAVNCRYCFRRHFPYNRDTAARQGWRDALAYIATTPDAREIILSGGDPLILATPRLRQLSTGLDAITHVRRLRIHSRMPVVLPERVDGPLLEWLSGLRQRSVLVIHCNHPNEVDESVIRALRAIQSTGVTVFNQAVLLRGINDSLTTQTQLAETLFDAGVIPYYLHLLDRVQGAAHFEVADSGARALYQAMRRNLPGYLLPRLVREIPGAPFKVPVL